MKNIVRLAGQIRSGVSKAILPFLCSASNLLAQDNAWTKTTSGNWEEPYWSLGTLPGPGQSVLLTNAGWKAVAIGWSTVANQPQSLTVNNLTISSPIDSFNSLLLNYAGFQMPLSVQALTIGSNSAMTMLASWLQLDGPNGVGMSIGGDFNQDDGSFVGGNQMDVGYIGPGVYNLKSGQLALNHNFVGGPYGGLFNQTGGINTNGIVHLDGEYNLADGEFGAVVYFNSGTVRQSGGRMHGLTIFQGGYLLENGINDGDLLIPINNGWCDKCGRAGVVQTGGTNYGSLEIGTWGDGSYTLSNGVLRAASVYVNGWGDFVQYAGSLAVTNRLTLDWDWIGRGGIISGSFGLSGGTVSCGSMFSVGPYSQSGGTNVVASAFSINEPYGSFVLAGGAFRSANIDVSPSRVGGFDITGGQLVISNQLTISGGSAYSTYGWRGANLTGGQLIVSNIVLLRDAKFFKSGASLTQSGVLSLAGGTLSLGSGTHQFGRLELDGDTYTTNSTISLSPSNACVLRFADSRSITWSNQAVLTIENWKGSVSGSGTQQVIVGSSSSALTAQQLRQIQFHNPAGAS